MTLSEYMHANRITLRQMGERLGVHASQVQRLAAGKRDPSIEQMIRIEAVTAGAVTAADFVQVAKQRAA